MLTFAESFANFRQDDAGRASCGAADTRGCCNPALRLDQCLPEVSFQCTRCAEGVPCVTEERDKGHNGGPYPSAEAFADMCAARTAQLDAARACMHDLQQVIARFKDPEAAVTTCQPGPRVHADFCSDATFGTKAECEADNGAGVAFGAWTRYALDTDDLCREACAVDEAS